MLKLTAVLSLVALFSANSMSADTISGSQRSASNNDLIGMWRGVINCSDIFLEFLFVADQKLATGVTGSFLSSWNPGWLEDRNHGTATLLKTSRTGDPDQSYVLSYTQRPDTFSTLRESSSFIFHSFENETLFGHTNRENCSDVIMSFSRDVDY